MEFVVCARALSRTAFLVATVAAVVGAVTLSRLTNANMILAAKFVRRAMPSLALQLVGTIRAISIAIANVERQGAVIVVALERS